MLALSRAADEVAARRYAAELPESSSSDEIAHLTERFREMTERLAEAEAYERNFLVRVSHELRTPITAIRGHVAALREDVADDPEAREASLEVIRAATDRLARLVGDLVDLARLEAHSFTLEEEEVELRAPRRAGLPVLRGGGQAARDPLRARAERRPGRAHRRRPRPADRLQPSLQRILVDARRRLDLGGRLEGQRLGARSPSRTRARAFAPIDRDRVFRPFVSENGEGTGLGLAISRELAQALGGDLKLDSVIGPRLALRAAPAGVLLAWSPSMR